MKNRKIFTAAFLLAFIAIVVVSSCKKNDMSEPLEPISVVHPDSAKVRIQAGDSTPVEIKFTTDRPINWVRGVYDIDTLVDSTSSYVPTYPYTQFFIHLDTLNPRTNLYDYKFTYSVPDSLRPFSVIRFLFSFQAGSANFVSGQNYPAGIDSFSKEFEIDVR